MPLDGEAFRGPDAKPTRQPRKDIRKVDRSMTTRACLEWRECPCGKPSATGHHVLGRGAPHFGDDVLANIVPLCGSGTTGCHGLVENEDKAACRRLGRWIREHRPDTVLYLASKLGSSRQADDWLRRRLYAPRVKGTKP